MTSIRKFVYAGLLAFAALNIVPSLASAQDSAHGQFTLPHDVHWQNAIVRAGEYKFFLESEGGLGVLKLSGLRSGFVFLVSDTDQGKPADASELVLQSTAVGSYVSAMRLPKFGMTLHFKVPTPAVENQMARAGATAGTAAAQ